jgi:hypothetical protein
MKDERAGDGGISRRRHTIPGRVFKDDADARSRDIASKM